VDKVLFSIICTTCQARLNVRDRAAIGEILTCPRCESFVQIIPPPGWDPSATSPSAPTLAETASAAPGAAPPLPDKPKPPPLPDAAALARLSDSTTEIELVLPESVWAGHASTVRKWLLRGVLPAGVAVAALSTWLIVSSPQKPADPLAEMKAELRATARPAPPVIPAIPKPEVARARQEQRWLPGDARLVMTLPLAQLAAMPDWPRLSDALDPFCRTTLRPLLDGLGLRADGVRRLTWAATDPQRAGDAGVVLLELVRDVDAEALNKSGQPASLVLAGVTCRRRADSTWKHPFAVIGPRAVLTGREDLLRKLAAGAAALESKPLERLLQTGMPPGAYSMRLDLNAARDSGLPLPLALWDVWPAGRPTWRTLWDMSDGLGVSVEAGEQLRVELSFSCEGESSAAKVKLALEEFLQNARGALSGQIGSMVAKLQAGQLTAPVAAQYETLLKAALQAIQVAKIEVSGQTVTLRTAWQQSFGELVHSAIESRSTMAADWLAAARTADEANHQRLATALVGHQKAEGRWPAAAAGGALLPPETRLSWIAAMLPYFGRGDWHKQLEFGYPWNGPQNKPVTKRPLEEVVNPSLGPGRTEAGFPTTHYVGVAGVGPDAAQLKATDPRAGVFGFGRTTRPEEITDGASNTVAVLGVTTNAGAWAAGGSATVRPLTKAPYVNGPDGFGSGQPDGMLAGMADGSVRFVGKAVDPRVLEQLATIHGGGESPLAALTAKPPPGAVAPPPNAEEKPAVAAKPAPKADQPPTAKPTAEMPAEPAQEPAKPAAPVVDLPTRLAAVIPEMDFPKTTLGELLPLIEAVSGVSVTLDLDALGRLGVTLNDRVNLRQSGKTVRELLDAVAAARGLVVTQVNNCVVLTSPEAERRSLKTIPYSVSDIAGIEPKNIAAFGDLVRMLVAPETWRTAGGQGTIKPSGDSLIVEQIDAVHGQLVDFCERLRAARGIPLRSRFNSEKFSLVTRTDRAMDVLSRPVTLNFFQPTPLGKILAGLSQGGQTKIVVDWAAQGVDGPASQPKGVLKAQGQTLGSALETLLRPLGLGFRAVDAGLLEVTTLKVIDQRLELEFYPVGELVTAGLSGPSMVERIKSQVPKPAWSDAGGPAELQFDSISSTLVVLQSQPAQRAIGRLLADLKAKTPAKAK
jgi:hypothetical protein